MPLWRSLGYARSTQLKAASSFFLLASLLAVCGSSFHMHCSCAWLSRKNRSAAARVVLLGLRAVSWAGHAGAVSLPASSALDSGFDCLGRAAEPGRSPAAASHAFSNLAGAALNPETGAAFAGQVAAHHAYVGFYAIARAVLSWGAGRGQQARAASRAPWRTAPLRSAHHSLASALGSLALASALYAWLSSAAPPHPLLASQYASMLSLFCHHLWVAGFLLAGAAAHACIDCVLHGARPAGGAGGQANEVTSEGRA